MSAVTGDVFALPGQRGRGLVDAFGRRIPRAVAIYVRISQDKTGEGLGVARQIELCQEWCERLGWQIVKVYVENDTSATSGKPREKWDQLMADIGAGLVDGIVGWHWDRLTRDMRELEDLIDLHDQAGVQLGTVTGDIDLTTPSGRAMARSMGVYARMEIERKIERQRAAELQAAKAGKIHSTGNTRPFGWAAPLDSTLVPEECDLIRDVAIRSLAGESTHGIVRSMNANGWRTSTGKLWTVNSLKVLLVQARLAGHREFRPNLSVLGQPRRRVRIGEILAHDVFPKIISDEQSQALREKFSGKGPRGPEISYLFSGILRCGIETCGYGLRGQSRRGVPRYSCVADAGRGCGRISILAGYVDEQVRNRILAALESPKFYAKLLQASAGAAEADHGAVAAKLETLSERKKRLAAAWAAGKVDDEEWFAASHEIKVATDQLKTKIPTVAPTAALTSYKTMDGLPWQRWDQLTKPGKRALVQACVHRVVIGPHNPTRARRLPDPDRIHFDWAA